jgi:hypothetical protein
VLIVSLDRWPDGAVRIAWRNPEQGIRVLVAEPGRGMPFIGRAETARVPYVVRDIAETVRLSGVRLSGVRPARFCAAEAAGGGAGGGASGGWWAAARHAAACQGAGRDEGAAEEVWPAPSSPQPLGRLRGWLSRVLRRRGQRLRGAR